MDCSISDNFQSFHVFSYSVQKGKNSLELECFTNFAEGEKGGWVGAKLPDIAPSALFSLVLPCKLTFLLAKTKSLKACNDNVKMLQIF